MIMSTNVIKSGTEKNDSKKTEDRWSELPTLLIWSIKDRLNFAENVSFTAVCKNWNSASQIYTPPVLEQCMVPWIIHPCSGSRFTEFINVTTMDKMVLDLPEFHKETELICSKNGWLLLKEIRRHLYDDEDNLEIVPNPATVILLNIHTNAKIVMSDPRQNPQKRPSASFSFSNEGHLSRVVFAERVFAEQSSHITLFVANIGDKIWSSYSNDKTESNVGPIVSLLVVRDLVHILDAFGTFYKFDMSSLEWRKVKRITEFQCPCWIMESEQWEIVIVNQCKLKVLSFFKLNDSQTRWERLSYNDVSESLFVSAFHPNNHFAVKEAKGTKKTYELRAHHRALHADYKKHVNCRVGRVASDIAIYKSINGIIMLDKLHQSEEKRTMSQWNCENSIDSMDYFKWVELSKHVKWVDLGHFDKAPPSCVRYISLAQQTRLSSSTM